MGRLRLLLAVVVVLAGGLFVTAQVREFKPVTDAMLLNPDPADWPNWRRTSDGQGYSPLKQINKENVQHLQLVWSWAMNPGRSEPTPLVSNGIMYLNMADGSVQALDAATGDMLWEFKAPKEIRGIQTLRNIAIYGDKVYTAVGARLVALDARTGAVVWDHRVADGKLGYGYTSGPIVAKGKIVAGIAGCEKYKNGNCFISAHDPQTGRELWRTSTIAGPGEPGGDTWGDLPLMFRAGADTWIAGTYDPKTNLIFYGTANPKPPARFQRGTEGNALYTNSTLALDPETGKIVWYYQHLPGESNDHDEVFERILIDYGGRSSVFSMGKLAIMWELDRKTGVFRNAYDLGYQTIVNVDPKTGKVAYRPEMIPKPNVELTFCPSTSGFKDWRAMAYHPDTQALYIPLLLTCEKDTYGPVEHVEGGGGHHPAERRTDIPHPESPDGLGEFLAMDIKTGKVLWRHRTRTPPNSGALATGGGLVTVGDFDRYLYVHDAATGKVLYQTRLPTSVQGSPITYAVRGRQYLAVPAGTGNGGVTGWGHVTLTPEKTTPTVGNSLFVFALPDNLSQSGAR